MHGRFGLRRFMPWGHEFIVSHTTPSRAGQDQALPAIEQIVVSLPEHGYA